MIKIDDTVISFDLFDQKFCCNLEQCHGICCIEGDSGAPLEPAEVDKIRNALPAIWNDLSDKAKAVIEKQGVAYVDIEGDTVTSIVDGKECVFSYMENGTCKCALEKAYKAGKTAFLKPISCHLYPVRLTKFDTFTAVNYHRWDICKCASRYGEKHGIPAYVFLKEALIRRFGVDWYKQLEIAANLYAQEKAKSKL